MHEISQELALWTDYETGEPKFYQDKFDELTQLAYDGFWDSEVGQKLRARNMDVDRFVRVFFQRFGPGVPHPGAPFVERLSEVGTDLLVELPEPVAPAPPPPVRTANRAPAREVPKPSAEAQKYAHLYNEAVPTHGIHSVRPAQGFVTIKVGAGSSAKAYRYPVADSNRLYEEAVKFNLID